MASVSKKTASKTEAGLNLQQEEFCKLYTNSESIDREMFGNGVQCYLEAYGDEYFESNKKPMSYLCAMAMSSRLLTNVKVINRINELLEEGGFNDQNVDRQHLFLINQHADLKTKMAAIKEYNAVKKRVEPNKQTLVVTISGESAKRYNIATG